MNLSVAPKHAAAIVWLVFCILCAAGGAVYYSATHRPMLRGPAQGAEAAATEDARRLQVALQRLDDLKKSEQSGLPAATGPGASIVAPAPLAAKKDAIAMEAPLDLDPSASLIVMNNGRRSIAVVNGRTIRTGQTLANGDVVQQIGRTFVVLRAASGELRRMDMQDRFSQRQPGPQTEKTR